ncbi:MAG: class I SAM-dependent methyltransferase, partial [Rhodospirillales bacterium]|nr:class I SAM-dependent methyltransferase [Rhodospirillales bacterium]
MGPLHEANSRSKQAPCKICGTPSLEFDHVDFNKYCDDLNCYKFGFSGFQVSYLRCRECGFLFTKDFDHWSSEDFRRYIYKNDFVSVTSYDPFSSPERPTGRFDIITSFEVIEHTPDPLGTFADMRSLLHDDGCIIVSQTLQPADILSIRGSWWYLAPRNGHVSTYTEECLEVIGRQGGHYFHRGDTVYAFVGPKPSEHAAIAAASIGPSFSSVKLYAPTALRERAVLGPDRLRIAWHVMESDEVETFRWTGDYGSFDWQGSCGRLQPTSWRSPCSRSTGSHSRPHSSGARSSPISTRRAAAAASCASKRPSLRGSPPRATAPSGWRFRSAPTGMGVKARRRPPEGRADRASRDAAAREATHRFGRERIRRHRRRRVALRAGDRRQPGLNRRRAACPRRSTTTARCRNVHAIRQIGGSAPRTS